MKIDADDRALKRHFDHFHSVVEDAKHHFGEWDGCDPVVWALLRVVQAQTAFAHAIEENVCYGESDDVVEAAIEERRKAIVALTEALASEARGYQ